MAYVANVKVLPQNALSLSGSHLELTGSTELKGNLTVDGEITAQKLIIEETVNTVVYSSGSVKLGDAPGGAQEDQHQISGSVHMSGSDAKFKVVNSLEVIDGTFKGDGSDLTDLKSAELTHVGSGTELLIAKSDGTFNLATLTGGPGVSFQSSNATNGTIQIDISADEIGAITKITGSDVHGIGAYDWAGNLASAPDGIVNSGSLRLIGQALALHQLATSGLIARTGAGTVAAREVEVSSGTSVLSVTNGDGIAGNPTLDLVSASANTAEALVVRDASGDFAAGTVTVTHLTASTLVSASAIYTPSMNADTAAVAGELTAQSVDATSLTGSLNVNQAQGGNELEGATAAGQLLIGNATSGEFDVASLGSNANGSQNSNIVVTTADGALDISLGVDLEGLTSVSASAGISAGTLTATNLTIEGGNSKVTGSTMTVDGQFVSASNVLVRDKFQNTGAMYLKIRTLTSSSSGPIAVAADDYMLSCNAAADAFTITLPSASTSGMQGRTFVVKKSDITSKAVTVSSNNIDGGSSFVLNGPYQAINFTSDGGKWLVH